MLPKSPSLPPAPQKAFARVYRLPSKPITRQPQEVPQVSSVPLENESTMRRLSF